MQGQIIAKAQKLSLFMIIISIAAIILMPLLPWTSVGEDDNTYVAHESQILVSGERAEEDVDDWKGDKDNDQYKIMKATAGLKDNLSGIGFYFWLCLIFAVIIMIGIKFYNMGPQFKLFSNITMLLGILVLIFSILIILNHVFFLGNIGEINDKIEGDKFDYGISVGYVLTMLFSVLLLLIALAFTASVVPIAARGLSSGMPRPAYQQGYQQPPQQMQQPMQQQTPPPVTPAPAPTPPPAQPPQQPPVQQQQQAPTPKFCPGCGTSIPGGAKFCPKCGNKF